MHPGEGIKDFRKGKGLSQPVFARSIGYSNGYLAEIELGKKKPSRRFLEKLFEVYGLSTDYVLYGLEEERIKYLMIKDVEVQYEALPTSTKKLLDNVKEILESKNEVMINALKANIKALLSAVGDKKNNKNKEDD
jgi:transcriptional regulator with XRE-family HTH domain